MIKQLRLLVEWLLKDSYQIQAEEQVINRLESLKGKEKPVEQALVFFNLKFSILKEMIENNDIDPYKSMNVNEDVKIYFGVVTHFRVPQLMGSIQFRECRLTRGESVRMRYINTIPRGPYFNLSIFYPKSRGLNPFSPFNKQYALSIFTSGQKFYTIEDLYSEGSEEYFWPVNLKIVAAEYAIYHGLYTSGFLETTRDKGLEIIIKRHMDLVKTIKKMQKKSQG